MNKRDVIRTVLDGKKPPYVPWSFSFTKEAFEKLQKHYGKNEIEDELQNHILGLGNAIGFFEDVGNDKVKDVFGVVWDRAIDKDIGVVEGQVISEPTLDNYSFPDPLSKKFFEDIPRKIEASGDKYRVFSIGFSLFERAWTLRGMETLMMDFYDNPGFVRNLLNTIADYNIAQVRKACEYDIDAIFFGDDWGQQHGLLIGPEVWREFIKPVLKRMYGEVKKRGKNVLIHSCGDVDELFDDLVEIGLDCFNPFQPEVMDVFALMDKYHGKLAFYGGLSTQRTLPKGSVQDVKSDSHKLIKNGLRGGYIFSPAHAVEGDVPVENILAFIESATSQPGFQK